MTQVCLVKRLVRSVLDCKAVCRFLFHAHIFGRRAAKSVGEWGKDALKSLAALSPKFSRAQNHQQCASYEG